MLSTDPHDIRDSFLEILQNKDPKVRKLETLALFKKLADLQVPINPSATLPLAAACRIGDIKIMKLYLQHKASSSPGVLLDALEAAKRDARAKDNKAKHDSLDRVIALTKNIYEASAAFNTNFPTGVGFTESLHLACFMGKPKENSYCSKGANKLPASVVFQNRRAYVLFPRKDRSKSSPNLIGGGSYKEVYPALKVDLTRCSVLEAVQIVPKGHARYFDAHGLAQMKKFSDLGTGFPRILMQTRYYSIKKHGEREIAVQTLWRGGSLKHYTKDMLVRRNEPPLAVEKQISMASGLARGMRKIHALNLVHGDVKPANCLFDGEGRSCITDFDLLHEAGSKVDMRQLKMYYGTLPYVSPEQLLNQYTEEGSGQPGDMYALGLVLYEMAIGKPEWFPTLTSHFEYFEPMIEKIRRKYAAGKVPYKKFVDKIKDMMSWSSIREGIVWKQQQLERRLDELAAIQAPTLEERYHLVIHKLLHPDPAKRLTAEQFYQEIKALKGSLPTPQAVGS